MIGFLAKFDTLFSKQIASLAALLLANFICALAITILLDDQDPEIKAIIQIGMVGVISTLSCMVLLKLNESRIAAAEAFDTLVATDKLTGLSNRENFQTQLQKHTDGDGTNKPFALMLIDIDRFKELNAFLGYSSADLVLQQFGERLSQLAEHSLDAARLSGDEFALIVLYDGSNKDLETQMRRVYDSLYKPYICNKQQVALTLSAGVTLYPDDGDNADGLNQNAHFALQRAKQEGYDRTCCYDEVADPKMLDEHFLSQDMDRALQEEEFKLFFQPQFDFNTGQQTGYEALVRWQHHERGLISPVDFIPIAEKNGLILPLSDFLLKKACETASQWVNPLKVAINLSPVQMRQNYIADKVMEILEETQLDPNRLELEVTESLFIDINDQVTKDLARLQKIGISIALDDFGTGYSSLAYLTSFPFDKIKIDRSFVENLPFDDGKMAIISAVIGMGKGLDRRITAEGIEDQETFEILRIAGCDEAQGYLLGKPRDLACDPGFEMGLVPDQQAASA